ncbi:DUF3800 domain-containing protein [Nesterenkonia aerolata]|uniref:DUF3800 domain-containing protein n=1 Tax=Nesterenkonia aerolata TaxID=3074079 RepID=A0ABU2DUJ8_9MICC|nr:DUF3800 domain-containing protein [Nesterenkonia sp. LY-0111]MDR8020051.1 DUF3800 domain-containing protein [Nesterenkonia sp. LY-0111]
MWLVYLDESGNTGSRLDDPYQPVHWIAAVLVPEEQVLALRRSLDGVVARALPDLVSEELHGAELFSGRGAWSALSPAARVAVYEEALATLSTHDCVVAHASINKTRLRPSTSHAPHLLAFQFIVEKIQQYISTHKEPMRQRALLIADETDEHNHFQLDLLRDMQDGDGGVGFNLTLRNIVDTVHFVESDTNRGVQLADLVAYGLQKQGRNRQQRANGEIVSRGNATLEQMIEDLVLPHVHTYRSTWPSAR